MHTVKTITRWVTGRMVKVSSPGGGHAVARRLRLVERYSGIRTGKAFAADLGILDKPLVCI